MTEHPFDAEGWLRQVRQDALYLRRVDLMRELRHGMASDPGHQRLDKVGTSGTVTDPSARLDAMIDADQEDQGRIADAAETHVALTRATITTNNG